MTPDNSVILVGMPGAGKSTIGILLAKELAKDFIDTDLLIQLQQGKTLQDIIEEQDYLALRKIEEGILLGMAHRNHVIATGGSAVYSNTGMTHLKTMGSVIFLDVPMNELLHRIGNYESRGIARRADQSFTDLFAERRNLYREFADTIIDCAGKKPAQIVGEIKLWLAEQDRTKTRSRKKAEWPCNRP